MSNDFGDVVMTHIQTKKAYTSAYKVKGNRV